MKDEELNTTLSKVLQGDIDAYWYIVDKHKLLVSSYIATILFNKSDVDDLTQEVFITAFNKLKDFDQSRTFTSWLVGIARFKMTNYMRSKKRQSNLVDKFREKVIELISPELESKMANDKDENIKILLQCISKLPQNMKLVVKSNLNGNKAQDLAHEMNSTCSAIYNLQYKANGLLRTCVQRELNNE
ncbi:MAG: sigma-70 family RNA polymerase sigma factor [Lentisphaeraceae bacterium]|nr:sigma-70 family RNA polymerase sigma factor [Lentisphaeraceae bacterium]